MPDKVIGVLGAAGKMGSGIALLCLKRLNGPVVLMDTSEERLEGLKQYLTSHEISLDRATFTTRLEDLKDADLIFEAILEEIELKVKIYSQLRELCKSTAFFLTNTSSIPISELDQRCKLDHRIIGFHFYNPPPVQKLVEVISAKETRTALRELASELCLQMGKIEVPARDIAGFIGNGHFIREILHACDLVAELSSNHKDHEALYMVNRVTQEYLVRPMGIFQLVDYVGLDVVRNICRVMTSHIEGQTFGHPLLDRLADGGRLGGQNSDGSQKEGIFTYEKGRPAAVYALSDDAVHSLQDEWRARCDEQLGALPSSHHRWKELFRDPEANAKLEPYFQALLSDSSLGATLAVRCLERSHQITQNLVHDGVALSEKDVGTVLKTGFAHLYAPSAPFEYANR